MARDSPGEDETRPREFREEDMNKAIIAPAGVTIGTLGAIRGDRAAVERTDDHDSLTDEIKQLLGWGDDEEEEREIRREHVDRYEDDAIYLQKNS